MKFDANTDVILFKTPLDSSYKNVFDDYETTADYLAFLSDVYPHKTVHLTNAKSRIDFNGEFTVIFSGYDSMDLHDYNYMCFTNNGVVKFAFIRSVNSKNDGESSSACEITCRLDVWANHYLEFKNKYTAVRTTRATFDTHLKPNYPSLAKQLKFGTVKTPVGFLQTNGDSYVILWQRVILSDSPKFEALDTSTFGPYSFSEMNLGGTYVMYRAVGLLRIDSGTKRLYWDDKQFQVYGFDANGHDKVLAYKSLTRTINLGECKSSFVISNTLCFSVPFRYYLQSETDTLVNFRIEPDRTDPTDAPKFAYGERVLVGSTEVVSNDRFFMLADGSKKVSCKFTTAVGYETLYPYDRYSTDPIEAYQRERIHNEYPFSYTSLMISGAEVPLIPISGYQNDYYIDYDCVQKVNPTIRLYGAEESLNYKSLQTSGMNDTRMLAYDEYMMRNSNSIAVEQQKIYFNMFSQFALGAGMAIAGVFPATPINNIINSGYQLQSIESNLDDLRQTASRIAGGVTYSIDNPNVLDLCIIVENAIKTLDSPAYDAIMDYHYNGYESSIISTFTGKYKDCFDVLQGSAETGASLNDSDKEEILGAFARGITKWHIWRRGATRDAIISGMNRNVINYNVSEII